MATSKQEAVVIEHLVKGDLEKMSADELVARIVAIKKRYPNARISGTAVVRKKDGTIRNDR